MTSRALILTLQVVASGVFLYFVYLTQLLPVKYFALLMAVLVVLIAIFWGIIQSGKKKEQENKHSKRIIISKVLSLLVSIVLIIGSTFAARGNTFLNNVQTTTQKYAINVIVLKDGKYGSAALKDLKGKRFGRSYEKEKSEDLAIINYTSGTTGYSKGVMLPYRSILSNVLYCKEKIGLKAGDSVVSMLPLGHVFGMTFDFLYGFTAGAHLWFLTRMPSPKIIAESFAEIRPRVIACVPLIVEKIFKKNILPKVDNKLGKLLLHVPIISDKIKELIKQKAMEVFGGNFIEIIIGGAPFNAEVEAFLKMIDFPYTIAYGMTECGPIICHSHWTELKLASCGKVAARMEAKVLSPNPSAIAGELVCRGANLMLGYYKNEEATRQVIDTEGWLHTGDMATIDENGNVFIKGRCKNLLLTSSGQNIYPEEIESRLNNLPYVNESLVIPYVSESLIILQQDKLVGLIYPDSDDAFAHGLNQSDLVRVMEENRLELNKQLPAFSQIARFKLYPEEFEKTAKKSIKRFLYQDIKE